MIKLDKEIEMLLLSDIQVKLETIELMDGLRIATQQDVDRLYSEWEESMGNDPDGLLWISYFAAYNSRTAYVEEKE